MDDEVNVGRRYFTARKFSISWKCAYSFMVTPTTQIKTTKLFTKPQQIHIHQNTEVIPRLNVPYFIPRGSPVRVSQRPHLLIATLYLELPLANPLLCLRSVCTNSSFDRFIICTQTARKDNANHFLCHLLIKSDKLIKMKTRKETCFISS